MLSPHRNTPGLGRRSRLTMGEHVGERRHRLDELANGLPGVNADRRLLGHEDSHTIRYVSNALYQAFMQALVGNLYA